MRLFLIKLLLLAGVFSECRSAIFTAAGIGAASAAASAITSGASMIHSMAGASGYSIVCTIVIENWTKYPLLYPGAHPNGGHLKSSPVSVLPGKRESFVAHNSGHGRTGSYGTASWYISNQNKRAVVMWSCPYSFKDFSNWLSVGFTRIGVYNHRDWFNQMYYEDSNWTLKFNRGEYYYHTHTIAYHDDKFEITGTMGTSHKARVHIVVRPLSEEDLAPQLKIAVHKKLLNQ